MNTASSRPSMRATRSRNSPVSSRKASIRPFTSSIPTVDLLAQLADVLSQPSEQAEDQGRKGDEADEFGVHDAILPPPFRPVHTPFRSGSCPRRRRTRGFM